MDKYLFMDTSALMHATNELQQLINEGAKLVICSTVLDELDRHKDGSNGEKKYKARQAFKLINNNTDSVKYIVDEIPDKFVLETLFYGFDMKQADNKILYACVAFMDANKEAEVVLITNDNGMIAKADML